MKLLYIDTDESFAAPLKRSLERGGIGVELFADGREAFDAARAEPPDAIVLAVELGDKLTGGYTWCQKLRKDDATRNVPLVLVSSQATPETFEQHRKLKNRADEYLQKPFDAAGLLEALGHHVELPISALEAVTAPEEEPLAADEDLARLDEAFDLLTADPGEPVAAAAEEGFEIALAEDLPAPEPTAAGADEAVPPPAPWAAGGDAGVEELRAQLAALESRFAQSERELAEAAAQVEASRATFGGRDRDYFQLRNESSRKEKEILRLREDLNRAERESLELREAQTGLEQRLVDLEDQLAHKEALARTALGRAEAAGAAERRAEATIAALRVEATRVPGLAAELERCSGERAGLAAELEGARADAEALRDRVAGLEGELAGERERAGAAEGEAARLGAELEAARQAAAAEAERLRGQVAELDAARASGEERLLEANLALEADRGAAERARQALATALAALDEVPAAAPEA
jgi:CheY-like chemotaxis protein